MGRRSHVGVTFRSPTPDPAPPVARRHPGCGQDDAAGWDRQAGRRRAGVASLAGRSHTSDASLVDQMIARCEALVPLFPDAPGPRQLRMVGSYRFLLSC